MASTDPRTEFLKHAMSRRGFLNSMGAAGAAAFLAACGTRGATGQNLQANQGGDSKTIVWANWTLYLDYDEESRTYPSLVEFEKESGYTVEYREDIDDNVSFNGKVAPQLANGQNIGYDIVTLTDWMAAEWIRKGYVSTIDDQTVPNKKNILPALENVAFDPGREYSLTWQSGFAGLAWNKERIPEGLKTVDDLWNPAFKGKVVVLSEMRDTIGCIMLSQGVDISEPFTDEQFIASGATMVPTAEELWAKADLIVKVKEPLPAEYALLRRGQLLFTYLHLAADLPQTEGLLQSGCVAIAYETVTDRHGRLPLLAPMSEVAGRMSVQVGAHLLERMQGGPGILIGGVPGVQAARVAVLGGGVSGDRKSVV